MKKIKNIAVLFALVPAMLLSSCSKEYLNRTPTTALDTDLVLNDPDKIPATVVGTMRMMYSASFGGKYATIIGDIMTDMVTSVRGSNGSFKDMEEWNINQATSDVETLYAAGFQIGAAAARTIQAAKRALADTSNAKLSTSQINNLQNTIAASLTIKVYTEYFLTQFFCVDVNVGKDDYKLGGGYTMPGAVSGRPKVGIMLLKDRPLEIGENANIYTLEDSYAFMEQEIAEAISYFEQSGSNTFVLAGNRYYPTLCAAYMVQARVHLAQHHYEQALEAAENALGHLPSGANRTLISDADKLLEAYGENLSSEDIWSLNYTSQDNLSANSLQNLFSSYGFNPSEYAVKLFKAEDIRTKLHFYKTPPGSTYCLKYPNENGVFNVPIFRVPEIYMVQAEALAAMGKTTEAKEALLNVIGARDPMVGDSMLALEARYPVDDANIMQTILDENAREFLCEGHRWYDLRRNGKRLTREGNSEDKQFPTHFTDYPLATFALPIPYGETSTEQWKKGRGVKAINEDGSLDLDNENWQNNAWDDKQGDTYSPTVTLPVEDGQYATESH